MALTGPDPQLVSLSDLKQYLGIPDTDDTLDTSLIRRIDAVRPVIEQITGPIIPTEFEEWHSGGSIQITLRRRPSTAYGTTPVLNLIACSEYLGPIEWPLAIVQSPDLAQLYSCMLDARRGVVIRTTAGGGVQPFAAQGPMAVHVIYQAGQSTVPANVYDGTLELLRVNYQQTMPVGAGSRTLADQTDTGTPLSFFVPRRVEEMLLPNRRYPSIA